MFIKLKNLTDRVVMMRLNSGLTIYLGPNAGPKKILATEIQNNSRLKRLEKRGIIDRTDVIQKKPSPKKSGNKAKGSKGKETASVKNKKTSANRSKKTARSQKMKSTKSKK